MRNIKESKINIQPEIDKADNVSNEATTDLDLDELSKERLGWKKIFLLPFEPAWEYILLIASYINALSLIFVATRSKSLLMGMEITNVGILFDVMYLIDNVFIIGCKIIPDLHIPATYFIRPNWIIVLEIISTIPVYVMMPKDDRFTVYARMLTFMELLRIPRVMYYFYYNRKMVGNKKSIILFVQAIVTTSILLLVTFFTLYCMTCFGVDCGYEQTWINLEDATSAITSNGFYDRYGAADKVIIVVPTVAAVISYFGIIVPSVGELVMVTITTWSHKYLFLYRTSQIRTALQDNKISSHVYGRVNQFYELFWKKRQGYSIDTSFLAMLPPAMRSELATDINWYALKHSKLFQSMDLSFLRAVALVMEQKFVTAGEYLYQKGKNKNRMIYIVSGIAQVISEEDGETPLISFSSGTCLGEISVVVNYNSNFSVICKEYCEIHVLEMKNFVSVVKSFPKQARQIRKIVFDRLENGKTMKKISHFSNVQHGIDEKDKPTLMWINNTLHRLMQRNEKSSKHEYQNVFLREDLDRHMFDQMQFTASNLDLLAITERIELVTDTVFFKTSFPCIFRPDSVVLQIWDNLVCIIGVIGAFIIPYYGLVEHDTPVWHRTAMIFLTSMYWIDVYLQMSTAVRTKDELLVSIKEIFIHRLENIDFVFDLFAAYPIEMYSSVIIHNPHSQSFACLYLNRIIKILKLKTVLAKYEGISTVQVIAFSYIKYLLVYGYIIYLATCTMYSLNCFYGVCKTPVPGKTTIRQLFWILFPATQLITGAGLQGSVLNGVQEFDALCCLLMYLSTFVYMRILVQITTIHILPNYPRLEIQAIYMDVKTVLLAHNALLPFKQRIKSYISTQWKHSGAQAFIATGAVMQELPLQIYGSIKENTFADIIKNQQLFRGLSDDIIYHLSVVCEIKTFPPKTVLAYSGQMKDTIYLITAGVCETISTITKKVERNIGVGGCVCLLEVFTRTPIVDTTITATHTKVLTFNFFKLMGVLTRFPFELNTFQEVLAHGKLNEKLMTLHREERKITYDLDYDEDRMESFHKIGFNLQIDSEEEYDYYVPFDRLGIFSIIRPFLMRVTFMPLGRFLFVWESFRWIFAVTSAIFFLINPVVTCRGCVWQYVLIFLDITAYCDIYLRFHIGYYDANGILVTHPLKTAENYLKHSFFIDLLAAFPFEYFIVPNSVSSCKTIMIATSTRMLQLYRYYGYFKMVGEDCIQRSKLAGILRHFPLLLVTCNTLAALHVNIDCDFYPEIKPTGKYAGGVICEADSLFANANFSSPYRPINVHLISLYFTASAVTMTGLQGFGVKSLTDRAFQAVYAFFGAFLSIYILGNITSVYTAKYSSLRYYQEGIKSVKEFLKKNKVTDRVFRDFIKHYETHWGKKRGRDIHFLVKNFDRALYEDVLYHVYGRTLEDCSVFKGNCDAFYRMLLPETRHEIVMNGTSLALVNDVKSDLHIVINGCFDVIAPDGSKLTTLYAGSMLGNLDSYPRVRQTVGYVANGHCEILSIDAMKFHGILQKFPSFNSRFKRLTVIHIDYLKGRRDATQEMIIVLSKNDSLISSIKNHVFDPETKMMIIWKLLILFVVCYIAPMLSIYTMSFNAFCIPCIMFQYICDVLFAIDFYIQYHTAYESDTGVMIKDIKLIRKKQNKESIHVVMSILCIVPYDVIIWFTPLKFTARNHVIALFRLIKVYRIVLIFKYFRQKEQRLDVNIILMQLIYLLFLISLMLHCFTCTIVVLGCFSKENLQPPIKCKYIASGNMDHNMELINIYLTHLYVVLMCFVKCAQGEFYPVSLGMVLFFTLYMMINTIFSCLVQIQIFIMAKILWHVQGKYESLITRILHYMEKESASIIIINRVWQYVRLLWIKQKGINYPILIERAPANLKAIVLNRCFEHHIQRSVLFKRCHEDFIRQVVPFFESYTYFPGDYVVFKGTVNECMYFIHEGGVLVLSEDAMCREEIVGRLKLGNSFGVLQGVNTNIPHEFSFRSSEISTVLMLDRKKWGYLLDYFPASKAVIFDAATTYTGW